MRVLELNVSPKLALRKQVVLNVNKTQTKNSSSSAVSIYAFELLFYMKHQTLTNTLYSGFFAILNIQSLHLEQTRDF